MSGVGQVFGGSFLSAFLQVAFDRFASPELLDFILRWEIDLDEVESLKRTSAMIQALSDEAEVKQFTNVAVKLWLDHLKQLLYDAEDILDEYATELLRLKLESAHQTRQVRNPPVPLTRSSTESSVSSWLNSGLESALEGIKGIAPKVYNITEDLQGIKGFHSKVRDINMRLKSVAQEGVALGLNLSIGSGSSRPKVFSQRPPTSSLVNTSNVFGREEDMEEIFRWLISDNTPSNDVNNFSVLPIVGMGGVGKTTLAQLVYNDERIEKHFGLKAWVCVSEDFDLVRLTKEILESVTRSCPPSNSLDLLQLKLKEALSKKRFLLVLDDMWNEIYDRWDALRTPFAFGQRGSKILVTTRNKGVSSIVRTAPYDIYLKGLPNEACFALVQRHAFMDEKSSDANQKLEVFGDEIVKKCKGLPLAIKTLAGLLRDKRENYEWKDILESEIWDLTESEILPSLMLSYHHLPPHVKRCFAYCALFPKDYEFRKIELVVLWMAEGLVQPKEKKRLEDIGAGYFDELVMRSFFELSIYHHSWATGSLLIGLSKEIHNRSLFESSSNTGSTFVMHDLIHDLAQYVSGGIYCKKESDKSSPVLTTTRHLSYVMHNYNVEATEFGAMKSLRTFLTLNDLASSPKHFFSTLEFQFQFLRVLRFRNCCNCELPDSIGKLKHLRFLDLSFSDIVRLPDSIGKLYNLQLLALTGCGRLRKLPNDMSNLINLRYLVLPAHWDFHKIPLGVGNMSCLQMLSTIDVGQKKKLSQLRGIRDNSSLEDVGNNGVEAIVAKPHLLGLQLHNLTSLRVLRISNYKNLESVSKKLCTLTSLQRLVIASCPTLVSLQETRLPTALKELKIFYCEKLGSLPKELQTLTYLKEFVIGSCPALVSFQETRLPSALEELEIIDCENLESLPMELLHNLTTFQRLVIKECPALETIPDMGLSTMLQEVSILNCGQLNSLPKGLHKFTSLKRLEIVECYFLMECKNLEPLHTSGLHNLISLSYLTIGGCHALMSLPNGLLPTNLRDFCIMDCPILESLYDGLSDLTSLKRLEIQNCPKLTKRYQKKEGEEWSNIAQIPKVIIDGIWQ
ncbi:putative disease resistance protein RGA3 isoform X1 [Macadamia integrifolia]|uniref:putative disease resistance protein RGA3 isoform X1 n=1 Tax=Macadamia integrifolia TaxID=60698 RepID=UPI001C52EF79|nr:putative disease resistance protein RGA3 isoform X1 [Macadamia integrifolia]XP_042478270.1 putative disease resistance protein RGA3 isoform X1 [Macadamia integrifolia]XP_042478271.1 putative disease resistance protein RGA3 isoform X1 [Macadamia integrifolia]XP_042478272.1 putative disease resistance protein RGA3 isoform X1 [Macadamia integrifolia]XP_042478273.1 putative disease resistance protein RGA3 isoform X1 [Macadamia integrifolia]XP_042478274.1 putative disease resistance protein RGA3